MHGCEVEAGRLELGGTLRGVCGCAQQTEPYEPSDGLVGQRMPGLALDRSLT